MVGLMLLIVVTLVALSAIRTTNTQQILAGNMQQRMIVYQGAESALRELVNDIDPPGGGAVVGQNLLVTTITNALDGDATTGPPPPVNLPGAYPGDMNATAALAYTGEALVPGGEIGAGTIVYRTFQVTATANMPAYNSSDTHFQGLWQLAPSL